MSEIPEGQLDVRVDRQAGVAVVRVRGSAGMTEAEPFGRRLEQLADEPFDLIVLDLSDLEFISSAGLGALVRAHGRLGGGRGRLRLVHPRPMVLRVLETMRLTRLFEVYPDVEGALKR